METRDLSRITHPPMYAVAPVVEVSAEAAASVPAEYLADGAELHHYRFYARVLRIEAPWSAEVYAVWYKHHFEPRMYSDLDTAMARAKRLVNADVKALKAGRKAPR